MRHSFLRSLAGQRDPYFKNVTLLLHGDGTNGGQNNTFLDSGPNNNTITRTGNVTQGSFSPFGDRWSNYFDGNTDWLKFTSSGSAVDFTGAYTIECFFWLHSNLTFSGSFGNFVGIVMNAGGSGLNGGIELLISSSSGATSLPSSISIGTFGAASPAGLSATFLDIGLNTWNHLAVVRDSGNNTSIFLNGLRVANGVISGAYASRDVRVGGNGDSSGYQGWFPGYISNLRVVKGSAVYDPTQTRLSVPTNPLTAIANTTLLTCQSNRFLDSSTNNFSVTRTGDVSVQRFSPFSPDAPYRTDRIAGSAYFSGANSNSLSASSSAVEIGRNAFTVESWVYYLGTNNHTWFNPSPGIPFTVIGTTLRCYYGPNGSLGFLSGAITPRAWTHIAVTRDFSNVLRLFVNGVFQSSAIVTDSHSSTPIIGERSGNGAPFSGYIAGFRLLIHTALYTSNFTPPSSPPAVINDTRWLINFTNSSIIDNGLMINWETVNSTQISTSVKKYGTGSIYNPGGSSLRANSITPNAFGTGDFTVECWLYPLGTQFGTPISNWTGPGNWAFLFEGQQITFSGPAAGYQVFVKDPTNITLNQWTHIAVSRASGTMRLFRNGVVVASAANSTNFTAAGQLSIGSLYGDGTSWQFNGYFDDIRITSGVARYTADFAPPTAPFPDF